VSPHTIGPYRLLEELGRGAMGVVFRAFDPAIDRQVAIKIIQTSQYANAEERDELKLRFSREATAAGKLSHPNIVTIHQLGEAGDVQYLVLELIDGRALEKDLAGGQAQALDFTVSVITQVADALDYAHASGIVHRDVKPANILIRPDGIAKITDFGIARIASNTVTRTGYTFGTPSYMSPEQLRSANVSGKADQFSLGVIAYQMLSGKKPFNADTPPALMFQIMSDTPPPLPTVNPTLPERTSQVIGKVLSKAPEDRYPTCLEFAEQLAESLHGVVATGERGHRTAGFRSAVRSPSTRIPLQAPQPEHRSGLSALLTPRNRRVAMWIATASALALALAISLWRPGSDKADSPMGSPGEATSGTTIERTNPRDGLNYVWIPKGSFQMGCSQDDPDCYDEENPPHPVTLSRGFWIGQTEVTETAYEHLMKTNPSRFKGAQLPVHNVSWNDAHAYCRAAGMRLPTEAEWEYAARAGNSGSRYGDIDTIAWYGANSDDQPHPVAQKQSNPWGLFDMLGNAYEWVADWYADQYPPGGATDPQGPPNGTRRALRGGAWGVNARNVRASMRLGNSVTQHNFDQYFGFRCAGN